MNTPSASMLSLQETGVMNGKRQLLGAAKVLGCAAILLAAPVHAAKWQQISPSSKTATEKVEIDSNSIDSSSEGKIKVWYRQRYSTRQLHEAWAFTYKSVKQLAEFNCKTHEFTLIQRIHFADDGSELKNEQFSEKLAQAIIPDSPAERVFNRVCRKTTGNGSEPEQVPERTQPVVKKKKPEPPPPPPIPQGPVPWSHTGKTGPAQWSSLSTDYATCGNGKWQSPIDIRAPIRADLPPIRFVWQVVPLAIMDTGHTIEVVVENGGHTLFEGEEYVLQGFRFRHPGEEVVNGQRPAMSVQFEHRSKSGRIMILAVPLVEGRENRLVRTLWNALPLEPGELKRPANQRIDPGLLIPTKRDYNIYAGSLTQPPCTEGVTWLVMKQPVTLSKEQIIDFAKVHKNNIRPVQASNGRTVKSSR